MLSTPNTLYTIEKHQPIHTKSYSNESGGKRPVSLSFNAIPQFRSCRGRSYAKSYDEIMHRQRTISSNSVESTGTCSSSFSSDIDDEFNFTDVDIVAPVLPCAPYPVDPYHFYCQVQNNTTTIDLIQELRQLLNECDIEFTCQVNKCKFKCVKYVHYSHVEFNIRLYTSNNALLLEFQRRSGSLLLWDGLYAVLYQRLLHWIDLSAPACIQSGTQKKVVPLDQSNISVEVWNKLATSPYTKTSGVEAMKIMITSQHADAQREGCSGLAVITKDSDNAYQVAKHGIVEYLVQLAASDDLEMARCAIGALGSISNALNSFPDHKLQAQTLEHIQGAVQVVVGMLLKANTTSLPLELLRECARALGRFVIACPLTVVACEAKAQLLNHISHHDGQLSQLCHEAIRALETQHVIL